jgi:hypothetical protein
MHQHEVAVVVRGAKLPFVSREVAPVTTLTPTCRIWYGCLCRMGVHVTYASRRRGSKHLEIHELGIASECGVGEWCYLLRNGQT